MAGCQQATWTHLLLQHHRIGLSKLQFGISFWGPSLNQCFCFCSELNLLSVILFELISSALDHQSEFRSHVFVYFSLISLWVPSPSFKVSQRTFYVFLLMRPPQIIHFLIFVRSRTGSMYHVIIIKLISLFRPSHFRTTSPCLATILSWGQSLQTHLHSWGIVGGLPPHSLYLTWFSSLIERWFAVQVSSSLCFSILGLAVCYMLNLGEILECLLRTGQRLRLQQMNY